MDPLTISAASGLRAKMESLEMLANNLANAATDGYKVDREGYSLYSSSAGDDAFNLPTIERPWTDFSQGTLRSTGNPLHMALAGNGLFAVNGPSGPLYTRNGNFRLNTKGELVTGEGYPVRLTGGGTMQLQSKSPLDVATDGTVRQDGQSLGQIELVSFPKTDGLVKEGSSYFRQADTTAKPVPATGTEVQQGKLESSNAGTPEGAVRLIQVMRQFEMLQRAVTLGNEMGRKTIEEVAKVGS
ncbi:MAG: flagellar hook basal-body protein [Bryobacteraceae bacterium]